MTEAVRIEVTDADRDGVWPAYDAVFGDQPDEATWRARVWERHLARAGFRLASALDADRLVGLAYGYTGEHGQWWTDQVATALAPDVAAAWLGGHFEMVSIGVVPDARGRGLGRGLLRAVVEGLPHDRLLLMTTDDPADPARRLYATQGWQVLGPGVGDHTVVMGRRA
ncbi:GNAT family N-acetyltransferase [Nocardioides rubriscoriae]|uniref:GNAT family N-acetyltransferase n=1 Tax=Nocardioides rubriscoriae TaxID=642762 RepID=UPI0011DFB722|nr:GNAT family N-acetyltransferase [Nocardioides rubriscoriae]